MAANFGFEPDRGGTRYFISYKTEDAERVGEIVRLLHEHGVPIWYDYGLEYGDEWESQISRNISDCEEMILFCYERSVLT